ncbi:MAG TPA: MBL fold metallo-hydrolase [Candidatus Polarisedimenticolaceae bacterium]|nr:MBL fold metallo-hydrolase [Candidatus Polarisedimenticolaceae bacterium]
MSELPDDVDPAPIPEPKDSALGIVLDRGRVLLGRRARRSRFMPGNLAFPGGRMEPEDRPGTAGAFERCVSREVLEETGLAIPETAWYPAGERTTPPIFPVRFRTRFFVAVAGGIPLPPVAPQPQEIETLAFEDPKGVLDAWAAGRALVPPPLLPILRLLVTLTDADPSRLAARIAAINAAEDPVPKIEFSPGVWVLPVRSRTLPPASCTNVWIPGGTTSVVIDPGSDDEAEHARLLRLVRRRADEGSPVTSVVLSHHHRDHVAGAARLAQALGVPVLAHAATLARVPALAGAPTRALVNGEVLDLGGMRLIAHHTPGHAPGHLAFYDEERRLLLAGDLVSGLSSILVGFAEGDMEDYLASLRRVAALAPKAVFPSHGPPIPGAALAAAVAHREERERLVAAALNDTPRALQDIARDAYADTPEAPAFLREMQTRAHLVHLKERGAARPEGEDLLRWSR